MLYVVLTSLPSGNVKFCLGLVEAALLRHECAVQALQVARHRPDLLSISGFRVDWKPTLTYATMAVMKAFGGTLLKLPYCIADLVSIVA